MTRTSGSSSLAPSLISGSVLQISHMSSSAMTSTPSCTSPKTEACFSATVTSSTRSASVMVPQPSNIVFTTARSELWVGGGAIGQPLGYGRRTTDQTR